MAKLQKDSSDVSSKPVYSFIVSLMRLFKSIKLAVFLILILSLLGFLGTIIPQVPEEFVTNPSGYSWWLENVAYYRFGFWTLILKALGFFNVFHSFLFIAAGVLLMLNIIVCTIMRIPKIRSRLSVANTIRDRSFYLNGDYNAELIRSSSKAESIGPSLIAIFKRYRYKIKQDMYGDLFYLAADKNRFSLIGTYAVHLSLFLFVIGFILGSSIGFRDASFIIAEDNIKNIGHNTGISLGLKSFTDEYWTDGTPKDYRSEVAVFENGKEVKRGTIKVNHPLIYKGIRFHQMFFGPAVKMLVMDSEGLVLFDNNVALPSVRISRPLQRPEGSFKLKGTDYSVVIIGSAVNGTDTLIGKDEIGIEIYENTDIPVAWTTLQLGISQKIAGLNITFMEHKKYSGLQVSREPGISLIWIASFLFISGLCMVFFFPRQQIWIAVCSVSSITTQMLVKLNSSKKFNAETEFLKLIAEIKTILGFREEIKK
ncbi:MAG: cytochrome c biogenesis protein ResB [Actinobacteria bacterium]|nr:cytochrome c biogenesis protein ResB [Actinomycetota bacterium]